MKSVTIATTLYGDDTFHVTFELTPELITKFKKAQTFLKDGDASDVRVAFDLNFVRPAGAADTAAWPATGRIAALESVSLTEPLLTADDLDSEEDDDLEPCEQLAHFVVDVSGVSITLNYETSIGEGDLIETPPIKIEELEALLAPPPKPARRKAVSNDTNKLLAALEKSIKKNDVGSALIEAKSLVTALNKGATLPDKWR